MSDSPLAALTQGVIFTGEAFVENHALLLKDGRVLDIVAQAAVPAEAEVYACPEAILAPGFIDCQVNGGGNVLFNDQPTAEGAVAIARAHAAYGTTRLLLTCITDTPEVTQKAVAAARAARKVCSNIFGVHLEGPHLSEARRGVHKADYLRGLTQEDLLLYRAEPDEVFLVTLAPDVVAAEIIVKLRQQGALVALGHTAASPEQVRAALQAGATGFTHLFNAMGGMAARAPGPAGVALDDRDSWCGIIADGVHVDDTMIRLASRAKPSGKLFLVSDAMPPAATDDPRSFRLNGDLIHVEGGCCVNAAGTLAGACLILAEAVRHCVQQVGIEPDEALRMASAYPAAFLGVSDRLGKLLPGYTGDVTILNFDLSCRHAWIDGRPFSS